MKKRLLIILCVVALVGVMVSSSVNAATSGEYQKKCSDTDGGYYSWNLWVKGTVTLSGGMSYTDHCNPSPFEDHIIEYFCDHNDNLGIQAVTCGNYDAVCQDGRCVRLGPTPTPEPIPEPKTFRITQFSVPWNIKGWARLGWVDGEGIFHPSTDYIRFAGPNEENLYWVDFFLNAEAYDKNVIIEVSYIDKTRAGFSLTPREWPRRTSEVKWIK